MARSGDFHVTSADPRGGTPGTPALPTRPEPASLVASPAATLQELDFLKKGWLALQSGQDKEWTRHWCVLSGSAIKMFPDMDAEKQAQPEFTIDLLDLTNVREISASRKYSFQMTGPGSEHVLSAPTAGIRKNWIQCVGQCVSANGGSLTVTPEPVSTTPSAGPPLPSRRSAERYHTHSGAYGVASPSDKSSAAEGDSLETGSNGLRQPRRRRAQLEGQGQTDAVIRTRRRRLTVDSVTADAAKGLDGDAGSREAERDISQYLEEGEPLSRQLSQAQQQELDNVEQNIRRIHRKSITEFVQQRSPQHFDKFESGAAFAEPVRAPGSATAAAGVGAGGGAAGGDRRRVLGPGGAREARESSASPGRNNDGGAAAASPRRGQEPPRTVSGGAVTTDYASPSYAPPPPPTLPLSHAPTSSATPSSSSSTPPRSMSPGDRRSPGDQPPRTAAGHKSPSVKVMDRSRARSPRPRSPPPQAINPDTDYLDTFVKNNLDSAAIRDARVLDEVGEPDAWHDVEEGALEAAANKRRASFTKLVDLQATVAEYEETIRSQQDDLERTRTKLKVAMGELDHLEAALTESANEQRLDQDQSQKACEELEDRVAELEKEIAGLRNELRRREQDDRRRDEDFRHLRNEFEEKCERVDALESELQAQEHAQEEVTSQVRLLEDVRQELTSKAQLLEDARHEVDVLRKQLREQDEQLHKAERNQAEKIQRMEGEFYEEKERLERTVQQLQLRLEQASKQSNMAEVMSEKDDTIAQLEEKVIENEGRLEELTEELNIEIQENNKLQQAVDEGDLGREQLRVELGQLRDELDHVKEQLLSHETPAAPVTEELESRVKGLEESNDSLAQTAESRRLELEEWRERCGEKEAEVGRLQEALGRSNAQVDGLEEKCNGMLAELESARDTVDALQQTQRLAGEGADQAAIADELANLRVEHEEAVVQWEEAEEANGKLFAELEQWEQRYREDVPGLEDQLAREREQSRDQLELAAKDLDLVKAEASELKDVVEELQQRHRSEIRDRESALEELQRKVTGLQEELRAAHEEGADRLARITAANQDPSGSHFAAREKSFSDIPASYEDLRETYRSLVTELKEQRAKLREATNSLSQSESQVVGLRQQLKNMEVGSEDQLHQLSAKVNDLTVKLNNAERRNRRHERRTRGTTDTFEADKETQTGNEAADAGGGDDVTTEEDSQTTRKLEAAEKRVENLLARLLSQRDLQVEIAQLQDSNEALQRTGNAEAVGAAGELNQAFNRIQATIVACSAKLCKIIQGCETGREVDLEDVKGRLDAVLAETRRESGSPMEGQEGRLKLFADRLALEAALMGEMSDIVRQDTVSAQPDLLQSWVFLRTALSKVSDLDRCVSPPKAPTGISNVPKDDVKRIERCASLLADKLQISLDLSDVLDLVGDSGTDPDGALVSGRGLCGVAEAALAHGNMDLAHSQPPSSLPVAGSAGALSTAAAAHAHLASLLEQLREQYSVDLEGESGVKSHMGKQISSVLDRLRDESGRVLARAKQYLDGKTQELIGVCCPDCAPGRAVQDFSLADDLFRKEFRHITRKYLTARCANCDDLTDSAKDMVSEAGDGVQGRCDTAVSDLISRLQSPCLHVRREEGATDRTSLSGSELELKRTSIILNLADVIAQSCIIQEFVSLASASVSIAQSTSEASEAGSLPSLPGGVWPSPRRGEVRRDVAQELAHEAVARYDVAAFLANNTANAATGARSGEDPRHHVALLAAHLAQVEGHLAGCLIPTGGGGGGGDHAGHVVREAMFQAQLAYVVGCLRAQHRNQLDALEKRLLQEAGSQRHEDGVSPAADAEAANQPGSDLGQATKPKATGPEPELGDRFPVGMIAENPDMTLQPESDLESELTRMENNYERQVQSLKDGYDIRIRSLQRDLAVAHKDLDRFQQEKEQEMNRNERQVERLEQDILDQEELLDRLQNERDAEAQAYDRRIAQLERELTVLHGSSAVGATGEGELGGATDEDDGHLRDPEMQSHLAEECTRLKIKEEETQRRMEELQRLQRDLSVDENGAAHGLLNSRVLQLEEQIHNMQSDYEQELDMQKAAHRRELARSKDDMLQLLAAAETQSIHIDEETIKKKYMKEIDRIKTMYDRSFATMERTHQRFIMELRKGHKKELDLVRLEKDQLLAEETKATQAALDAMRKAHKAELEKERNKFLNIITKTYSKADVECFQKQHEEDLEVLQQEMRQLSEQYSIKCLETASLEQRLETQTRSLHQTRKRIQDLMARNEELNSRLKHEIDRLNRQVAIRASSPTSPRDLEPPETQELKELEESMERNHELNSTQQEESLRYRREVDSLRRLIQQHDSLPLQDSEELEESLRDSEVSRHSAELTSTPLPRKDTLDSDSDASGHPPRMSKMADSSSDEVSSQSSGRRLPAVTAEARSAKKVLWRQKHPERARSTPGLLDIRPLAFRKRPSIDETTLRPGVRLLGRAESVPVGGGGLMSPRAGAPLPPMDEPSTGENDDVTFRASPL